MEYEISSCYNKMNQLFIIQNYSCVKWKCSWCEVVSCRLVTLWLPWEIIVSLLIISIYVFFSLTINFRSFFYVFICDNREIFLSVVLVNRAKSQYMTCFSSLFKVGLLEWNIQANILEITSLVNQPNSSQN